MLENNLFLEDEMVNSKRVLHTPSDTIRKSFLYMQEVGVLTSMKPHTCYRENLQSYLIFIVLDGEGTVVYDDEEYYFRKGDCAFIDCSKHYFHRSSDDKPWSLKWLHFYGTNAVDYYRIFISRNKGIIKFSPRNIDLISTILDRILGYEDHKNLLTELKVANSIGELITYCIEYVSEGISLEKIRAYINDNYNSDNLVENIETTFDISEQKLDEVFNENYGIILRDYILIRRFTKAKELLRFTILDVKDIIDKSGIKNDDLFRRLFLENEGVTPEEYRKKWAQWIK